MFNNHAFGASVMECRRALSISLTQKNISQEYIKNTAETLGLLPFFMNGLRTMVIRLNADPSSLSMEIFAAQCFEAEQAFSLAFLNREILHISHCDGTGRLVFHLFYNKDERYERIQEHAAKVSELLSYSYPHSYRIGGVVSKTEDIYAAYVKCMTAFEIDVVLFKSIPNIFSEQQSGFSQGHNHGHLRNQTKRAIIIMEEKYSETGLSIESIASAAHLTSAHFCRIFKEDTGVTPLTYLTEVRINLAKSLLTLSENTVRSVALASGFEYEEYFYRVFRKYTEMTPTQYRNKAKIHKDRDI